MPVVFYVGPSLFHKLRRDLMASSWQGVLVLYFVRLAVVLQCFCRGVRVCSCDTLYLDARQTKSLPACLLCLSQSARIQQLSYVEQRVYRYTCDKRAWQRYVMKVYVIWPTALSSFHAPYFEIWVECCY